MIRLFGGDHVCQIAKVSTRDGNFLSKNVLHKYDEFVQIRRTATKV